ncbi:Transcriptional activator ARO80 [Vanrija pseudolonga]|uniref:Transcriptional activator ARO80 n=1 Tax=Vanrija pseudolonga TaxID=143232 RepID=A0AAF1BL87_9TREE|nr:Transcriptional activator ARO80 [Vanrija pseudolonga]
MNADADAAAQHAAEEAKKERAKRGYRACLHCRSRKAKCDLGDIDAPSSPPCSRCRRESRECVFAPSRRGGNNAKKRRDAEAAAGNGGGSSGGGGGGSLGLTTGAPLPPPHRAPPSAYPPNVDVLNPSPKTEVYLFNHPSVSSTDMSPGTDPSPIAMLSDAGRDSISGHSMRHERERERPRSPDTKRRRLHLGPSLQTTDPSSIVVADMQNESDALHILALASAGRPSSEGSKSPRQAAARAPVRRRFESPARIEDFALIRLGIVDEETVTRLTNVFFRFHHHFFPMVPAAMIPRTPEQLAELAVSERYLVSAMIIIASRNDRAPGMRTVHERAWGVMRGWISDIACLGAPPTVGFVEALLLLAENLPRDPPYPGSGDPVHAQGFGEEVHGSENRQAWMLIGTAIRAAYMLGLDKLALKLLNETERTFEVERARLAYTYCYLFDRHVSLRLGKAFWSRGPNLCFQGFSASAQTGPAAAPGNFPFLREIAGSSPAGEYQQEDLASLIQTYLELTQLMSNAHDVLYPNPARTRSLVVYGEYFKYIDELARSLDGFKILWRDKKWKLFPLTDAVWAMFYYTQLYICAFSFQAHVERASIRAEEEYNNDTTHDGPRPPLSLFPRGAAASPDARYIFQSIDAARQLLHICVDRLHPGGALPYLPNRFLLWFTYAAIVLLKALYSGAMLRADHAPAHKLIDRLCECFAEASLDKDHPAVRYGLQLQSLRRKLAGMSNSAHSPTGGNTVPLPQSVKTPVEKTPGVDTSVPWIGDPPPSDSSWFPSAPAASAPISFPYSTPVPGTAPAAYVAPPHQQPLSEVVNLHPRDVTVDNNLGFATLDDWFGMAGNGGQSENPFEALDLADFWMKVGPGEAQGGFPFR